MNKDDFPALRWVSLLTDIGAVSRRAILLTVLLTPTMLSAQAPNFVWAKRAGGLGSDSCRALAVDRSGNCYLTGWFSGTATFGGTTVNGAATSDIYVAKYDNGGNLLWVRHAGGGTYNEGDGIAVDNSGNCYVIGYFTGPLTFGTNTLTSNGQGDVFLAKYDNSGNVLWARSWGGAGQDYGKAIAVDAGGNCYVTGASGGIFLRKYDTAGNVLWSRFTGGGYDEGNGIAVDHLGNCYVTGDDGGSGGRVVYLYKYDTGGNIVWANRVGPGAGTGSFNYAFGVAAGPGGTCYMTGTFYGEVILGKDTLTAWPSGNLFVARFDAAGNPIWARQATGSQTSTSVGITVDSIGDCYITGYFAGSTTFGATTLSSGPLGENLFVADYDSVGNVKFAQQTGGTGVAFGHGVGLDGMGHFFVAGDFGGSTTFGDTTIASSGNHDGDIFLAMLPVQTGELVVSVEAPPTTGTSYTNVSQVILTLQSQIPQALLFYTLDGSLPTPASTAYTGPFAVSNSVTLRVVAYNPVDFTSVESGPIPITIRRGHYLTLLPSTGSGTIAVSPPGQFFTSGTPVQLTAKPDVGWNFGNWQGDLQGSTNPVTLVMDRDWRVSAVFQLPPSYALSVQTVGGGLVTGDPPGNYAPGSVVHLVAQPDPGWLFRTWGGDSSSTSTNLTLAMTRDLDVIAYFEPNTLLTTTAGGGSIEGNTQQGYPQGTVVTLTAVPDTGWQFLKWMGASQDTNPTVAVTMTGPQEVQAMFGTQVNFTNVGNGTILMNLPPEAVPWGATLHLTAVPTAGYFFALWGNAARSTSNPLDFTVTNANPTIAALFLPLATNQVTLTALSDGFGRVVTTPAANVYTNGQTVVLTAAPGFGQQFLGWSGSFSGSQKPLTVSLTNSESVTAQFTSKLSLSAEAILLQKGTIAARVTVNGLATTSYEVQSSPDWMTWSKFGTLSLPTGEAQFVDSAASGIPQRFFRAVQSP